MVVLAWFGQTRPPTGQIRPMGGPIWQPIARSASPWPNLATWPDVAAQPDLVMLPWPHCFIKKEGVCGVLVPSRPWPEPGHLRPVTRNLRHSKEAHVFFVKKKMLAKAGKTWPPPTNQLLAILKGVFFYFYDLTNLGRPYDRTTKIKDRA